MNLCACGITAEDNGTVCRRCAALRTLELRAGASEREIKAAYRMLVRVWHPDRFQGDKTLKDAADAKLKSVNTAYVYLTSASSMEDRREYARDASQDAARQEPSTKDRSTASRPQTGKKAHYVSPARSTSTWLFPTLKILFRVAVVLLAILIGRYMWIAFDLQDLSGEAATILGYGKDSVLNGLDTPKRRFLNAVEQDLRRLDPSRPVPAALPQTDEPATASIPINDHSSIGRQQAKAPIAPRKIYPYITLGSTKEEVLEQQGTPTAFSENKLVYGHSELYFNNNSVVGWRIDPVSSPIRVKLWPESPVDTSLDSFTVGSSKDVVLVVQGTPTAFSEDKFEYGGSEVYFQNNRVVRWKNDPGSIQLRTKIY